MIGTILALAPSILKLFSSDDKSDAVKSITTEVVKGAAQALGIKADKKEDVLNHLTKNPQDAYKLKKLESDFEIRIKELDLKEMQIHLESKKASVEIFKEDHSIQENLVWHINIQFYFVVLLGIATLFATANFIDDKGLAMAISGFVSMLMTLVTNRVAAVDGFFFGSSIGSKNKEKKLNFLNTNKEK